MAEVLRPAGKNAIDKTARVHAESSDSETTAVPKSKITPENIFEVFFFFFFFLVAKSTALFNIKCWEQVHTHDYNMTITSQTIIHFLFWQWGVNDPNEKCFERNELRTFLWTCLFWHYFTELGKDGRELERGTVFSLKKKKI